MKPPEGLRESVLEEFNPYSRLEGEELWFQEELMEQKGADFWDPPGLDQKYAESEWIVYRFLSREPGEKIEVSSLIPMQEMYDRDADMVSQVREKVLNMEYDWKRELVDPTEPERISENPSTSIKHLFARSRPWTSRGEFTRVRELFDNWRIKEKDVLKTMADWKSWQEYQRTAAASAKGISQSKKGYMDQVRRNFIQAYATFSWGLPGGDYKVIAAFLSEHGCPTTVNDLKNAKHKKGALVEHAFERTDEVMKFINTILGRYPKFDWKKMVVEKTAD